MVVPLQCTSMCPNVFSVPAPYCVSIHLRKIVRKTTKTQKWLLACMRGCCVTSFFHSSGGLRPYGVVLLVRHVTALFEGEETKMFLRFPRPLPLVVLLIVQRQPHAVDVVQPLLENQQTGFLPQLWRYKLNMKANFETMFSLERLKG
jgi:hypothetical protein